MKATIIGAGNIGMALAEGLIRASVCKKQDITLARRNALALANHEKEGFKVNANNSHAIKDADTVFICVLPQQLNEVLEELKPGVDVGRQLFVSVVTGAHTQVFTEKLGARLRIIRAMPNTAMRVGESMTCLAATNATEKDIALVKDIFNTMGQSLFINEDMMSADEFIRRIPNQ